LKTKNARGADQREAYRMIERDAFAEIEHREGGEHRERDRFLHGLELGRASFGFIRAVSCAELPSLSHCCRNTAGTPTGMPCTGLRDAIIAHPTMAEGLVALLSDVPPQ
jgi:hypothetical protein